MDSKVKKDDSKKVSNLVKVSPINDVAKLDPKRVKTGGRVKGTPNILTHELRETLKQFVSDEIENLSKEDVLSKLTYNERLVFLTKILPYVLPKVQPLLSEYDSGTDWNI
jgi:membrane-bound lytic murein transglycosylase MltF